MYHHFQVPSEVQFLSKESVEQTSQFASSSRPILRLTRCTSKITTPYTQQLGRGKVYSKVSLTLATLCAMFRWAVGVAWCSVVWCGGCGGCGGCGECGEMWWCCRCDVLEYRVVRGIVCKIQNK